MFLQQDHLQTIITIKSQVGIHLNRLLFPEIFWLVRVSLVKIMWDVPKENSNNLKLFTFGIKHTASTREQDICVKCLLGWILCQQYYGNNWQVLLLQWWKIFGSYFKKLFCLCFLRLRWITVLQLFKKH